MIEKPLSRPDKQRNAKHALVFIFEFEFDFTKAD